jgi:hypothetical protein
MEYPEVKEDDRDTYDSKNGTGESSFANMDAKEPQSIDSDNNEGQAIDTRDRRDASKQGVIDLRYTELVPRKTGDAGTG